MGLNHRTRADGHFIPAWKMRLSHLGLGGWFVDLLNHFRRGGIMSILTSCRQMGSMGTDIALAAAKALNYILYIRGQKWDWGSPEELWLWPFAIESQAGGKPAFWDDLSMDDVFHGGSDSRRLGNYRKNRVCDAFTDTFLLFEMVQTGKAAGRFKNGLLKIKRRSIRQRGEKTL